MDREIIDKNIRHMPPSHVIDLTAILDLDNNWKSLMSSIKNDDSPESDYKYTMKHVRLIEQAGEKEKRSCSEILLEEWGTSGKKLPKYSSLLSYLVDARLFRAAEYVHHKLLQCKDPLERPEHGPAARVVIPEISPSCSQKTSNESLFTNTLQTTQDFSSANSTHSPAQPIISVTVPVSSLSGYPKEFKYGDLKDWSKCFSKRLGHGSFGSVYLCEVPEPPSQVAVKRLQLNSLVMPLNQLSIQFNNEINTLSKFKHNNVLSLLGYCCDGPELCLVYNYMPNGSLEDKIKEKSKDLEWNVRLQISKGVASGIVYLHSFTDKPYIHRDIKSANILLDDQLNPKLGDFGLARPAPMETCATTTIVGTTAYMSPEALKGDISIKMDVYSFGVVLLELITGLLAWDENRESRSLVSYIDEVDNIETIIDRNPTKPDDNLALGLYEISLECLYDKTQKRPTMEQVLSHLAKLKPSEED